MKKIKSKISELWGSELIVKLRLAVLIAVILLVMAISPIVAYHFYTEYKFWQDYGLQMQEDLVKEQDLTARLTEMMQVHCLAPRGWEDIEWASKKNNTKKNLPEPKKKKQTKKAEK